MTAVRFTWSSKQYTEYQSSNIVLGSLFTRSYQAKKNRSMIS